MDKTSKYSGALFLLIFTFLQLNAASPKAPYDLRCCDKENPIGTNDKPYFAWFLDDSDNDKIQSHYQLIVASSRANIETNNGDVWDSGKVNSSMQNYVYYEGEPLKAASQYYWKVRSWDKDENVSVYSASATFVTGLFTNNDWSGAKWIKRDTKARDDYTYYRKKITLPNKKVKRALAYMSASHSYELYLNGKRLGKGFNHHYAHYSYYQAWDLTSAIVADAENQLACLTHWYAGGQGRATAARGLLMKVVVEYTDGTSTMIGTDKSWTQAQAKQWITGQAQRNGEGVGRIEKYDSRQELTDWSTLDFNDSSWDAAVVIGAQPTAPWTGVLRSDLTRVIEEEIKPLSIVQLDNGDYVIDLGKIYSGSFKISFEGGNSGDTIQMLGGFVLNDNGTVSSEINQSTKLDFTFIHNGKTAVFNPAVYFGLRYLQVENAPNTLTKENVNFVFRHYEFDPSHSSFESSNQMLNDVWHLMVHSLLVGAQEGFVDTPTREKGTFLGDSWSQGVPGMSVMYDRVMNLRALNEFLDSQDQYWPDGRLNAVYPNVDGGRDIPDYTQSFLVWIWDYYIQTGHVDFLKSHYTQFKKIADYVDTYTNDTTGLIHNLAGGSGPYECGIIDWPMDMRYGYDMGAESRTVVDAYAYADYDIMAKIAAVIGNDADNKIYLAKAEKIKVAMNAALLNEQGVYIDGIYSDHTPSAHVSQHANILPLALDIAPEANKKAIVAAIKSRQMSVGMICLRWLPESLGKADEGEHLIDLYTNTTWDGWAKNITQGATVTWESWNAIEKNESLSHPWGAVGLLAMQNYILGVKPTSPQCETVDIKPLWFGDKLTYAKGTYPTDRGDITVDWERSKGKYQLKISIPTNVTARVYVPKCNKEGERLVMNNKTINGVEQGNYIYVEDVGSGKYTFER
ncbi:MAG: family 78 glycoside hydrolase catalytic domain [Bacteroidales bacterium]|nr:family 78 glycoside hydrolase catalytic domain [Bacteroidales bacterium]